MSVLSGLNPAPIWIYFEEICKIPRLSKNEGRIRNYLLDFATRNKLESKEDSAGNILIVRPASQGYENISTLVLQSHMDMVGEKNADNPHNWSADPIIPVPDNGWVKASGTTLGADDGVGIAAQMAILTDNNLKAGKIECLFTVDEESGMTGALNLKPDFFEGRVLINLDSEDEGILFIGCAGGIDTICNMKFKSLPVPDGMTALAISVTGLRGGHSGDEIHIGYGNAIKLMNRILLDLSDKFDTLLSIFNGGNMRNAIPRESFSVIAVKKELKDDVTNRVTAFQREFEAELGAIEKELKVTIKEDDIPAFVMDRDSQTKLLDSLDRCPHGVIAWSKDIEDLVETSTNLASIRFAGDDSLRIVTTQRSSVESSKHSAAAMVRSSFETTDATISHSEGYPGWKPDLNSGILKITVESYNRLFGKLPEVKAIHAGLECGLIYEKFKGIDMISFGPTIRGAHTPEERIEIRTVQMFWDLLTEVIRNTPAKPK
jgi:dipeptidase D